MISFQSVKFKDFYCEALPLLEEHNKEIDLYGLPLDVDTNVYEAVDDLGNLRTFTMREDGELIGYCLFFLFNHPHHKTSIQAKQDVLLIRKDKRGCGSLLIKHCDEMLKQEGIEFVHQCVPSSNDWGKVLERIGYEKLETIYKRRL